MKKLLLYAAGVVVAVCSICGWMLLSQGSDPDPKRYANQIEEFIRQDELMAPKAGSILFVGSSSIRRWDLAEYFPGLPTLNRGFDGSQISDINYYIENVVLRYEPRVVVFYAGENNIAGRKSASQVFTDYRLFVNTVTERKPETDIIFISIKPSPKRMKSWPEMSAANKNISLFSLCYRNYHFIDVSKNMLNQHGEPRNSLYIEDGIHMKSEGYDLWTELLYPRLRAEYET